MSESDTEKPRFSLVDKEEAKRGFMIYDAETNRYPLLCTTGKSAKAREFAERVVALMNAAADGLPRQPTSSKTDPTLKYDW